MKKLFMISFVLALSPLFLGCITNTSDNTKGDNTTPPIITTQAQTTTTLINEKITKTTTKIATTTTTKDLIPSNATSTTLTNSKYCEYDSECACGMSKVSNVCTIGNYKTIFGVLHPECVDFCSSAKRKCVYNKCT